MVSDRRWRIEAADGLPHEEQSSAGRGIAASPALASWLDDGKAPAPPAACGHTEGPGHDCAYVDRRNAMVAHAERYANQAVGVVRDDDPPESRARWNRAFAAQMGRLMDALCEGK